jgi:hypothetical protein
MAIRGITFPKQTVTSNDDAHINQILLAGRKGKTKGCNMTFGKDDIYISEGYFFAANRLIQIPSTETIATPVIATGTTYCRVVFELDMRKINTNLEFNQGYFKVLSSTLNYPDVMQEDIENGGNVYQLPFAKFVKTVNGIANFVSELETIGFADRSKTIYVDYRGNDEIADGSTTHPFKSIQAAINSIPKFLAGHTITIDVGFGVYNERLLLENFVGGKIIFGNPGNVFTIIGGIDIDNCSCVESNIYQIERNTESSRPLFVAKNGSNVFIYSDMVIDGIDAGTTGMIVENNSHVVANNNMKLTANNCGGIASANTNSFISFDIIEGSENIVGVQASRGAIVSYKTNTASTMWGNNATSGGLILTGSNSTNLSGATLDL